MPEHDAYFAGVTYLPGDTLEVICFVCINVAVARRWIAFRQAVG